MALRFLVIAAATALLAAIAICSLSPSSYMAEPPFIPDWLGTWADRNGNFRNMPVFAVLAALLFVVWNLLSPFSDIRPPTSGKSFGLFVRWSPRRPVSGLPTSGCLRRATLCFGAVALLGTALEFLQQMVPERKEYAHPLQIMWSVAGAFVGAFGAALLMQLFYTSNGAGLPTDAPKSDGLAQP